MLLALEKQLAVELNRVFEEERRSALLEVDELWKRKASDYDQECGVLQRSPLGEGSFVHELVKKIGRLAASWFRPEGPQIEDLEDQLRDIANYAIGLIAYRRALRQLEGVELEFRRQEPPGTAVEEPLGPAARPGLRRLHAEAKVAPSGAAQHP